MHDQHSSRPVDAAPTRTDAPRGLPVRTRLKAGYYDQSLPQWGKPRTGFLGSMGDMTDI